MKVEKVDWKNKDTVCPGPSTIFEKEYNVSNGQLSVTVNGCNESSGYRIYVTKSGSDANSGKVEPPTEVTSVTIPEGTYKIINGSSGKALTVQNDSTNDAANVVQWTESGKTSQEWIISEDGGYKILNANARKALDVEKDSMADGGNVIIWRDTGHLNQRWEIESAGNGYFIIKNFNSGKVLDISNNSNQDGGNVVQWSSTNNLNQKWKLVATGDTKPINTNPSPGQRQGQGQSQTPIFNASSCSEAIIKQGYKCCPSNCIIYYSDEDGTWGVDHGQ